MESGCLNPLTSIDTVAVLYSATMHTVDASIENSLPRKQFNCDNEHKLSASVPFQQQSRLRRNRYMLQKSLWFAYEACGSLAFTSSLCNSTHHNKHTESVSFKLWNSIYLATRIRLLPCYLLCSHVVCALHDLSLGILHVRLRSVKRRLYRVSWAQNRRAPCVTVNLTSLSFFGWGVCPALVDTGLPDKSFLMFLF